MIAPGEGFGDSRTGGKPLLLLRLEMYRKPLPGASKLPPGPPKPTETKRTTKQQIKQLCLGRTLVGGYSWMDFWNKFEGIWVGLRGKTSPSK